MADWFEFTLDAVKSFVSMLFRLEIPDIGFTLGDVLLACAVLGIVGSALIIKSAHLGVDRSYGSKGTFRTGSGSSGRDLHDD